MVFAAFLVFYVGALFCFGSCFMVFGCVLSFSIGFGRLFTVLSGFSILFPLLLTHRPLFSCPVSAASRASSSRRFSQRRRKGGSSAKAGCDEGRHSSGAQAASEKVWGRLNLGPTNRKNSKQVGIWMGFLV